MPVRVFSRSPGVTAQEVDNSQSTQQAPVGIPAGIIGTAARGPAFVPKFFGKGGYNTIFGDISSDYFGSLAASMWLQNADSCLYIRVLGAGDCNARNANGTVTNAGFTVGDEIPQPNDIVGANPFANSSATFATKGRTYFLGCFMSESNGSTIFSDAGIQKGPVGVQAATLTDALTNTATGNSDGDTFTITTPAGMGPDSSKTIIITIKNLMSNPTGNNIFVNMAGGNAENQIANIISAINGIDDQTKVKYGDGIDAGSTAGIANLTAAEGSTNLKITLTADLSIGDVGNSITLAESLTNGSLAAASLSGGVTASQAVPILRAVMLAPSGVILHLSGCGNANGNDVASMTTTAGANNSIFGNKGGITGSVNLNDSTFVMIMNGFKGTGGTVESDNSDNSPYITCSFDPDSSFYFSKNAKINTDPNLIEEKGHLLMAHFEINEGMAFVTGSGAVKAGVVAKGSTIGQPNRIEDIAFLLTGSVGRGASSTTIPDYEDFRDRFSSAETPYITSQKLGGRVYDLFKLCRLDDGEIDNRYFIQIENINYQTDDTKYGTFDIVIRDVFDNGLIDRHTDLSLDPSSPNYISRIIGDQKAYFDFDNDSESQKIIVEGSFQGTDKLFRVELSDDVVAGNIPKNAAPMGFRGPGHLVTSGSVLCGESDGDVYNASDLIQRIVQPPFPYRKNIIKFESNQPKPNTALYWGTNAAVPSDPADLNNPNVTPDGLVERTIEFYTKFYANHRTDRPPIFAKNRPGDVTSTTTLLDTDAFNYNFFSLENIQVITGSGTTEGGDLPADTTLWASASYIRSGLIDSNDDNKTRALEPNDLTNQTNRGFAKFTVPVMNGFNGHNIFSSEKSKMSYRATKMEIDDEPNQGGLKGPTISAYRKAIDIIGSKTDVDAQVLAIPGQRHPSVTDYAITAVENRFDAFLVMDIEERDKNNLIASSSAQKTIDPNDTTKGISITNTVADFKNRNLDTSFAAAYFPDVTISLGGADKGDIPPTVAALGAIAKSDKLTGFSFFAPAGTSRSTLNSLIDISGPSINTIELNDLVYDADINPIVSFPGISGPFINGQKTLLRDQSALDRIDVRRMLIDIRRQVKEIANRLLFEPNRASTLEKFTASANDVMRQFKSAGGVSRYKVVIDTTTTTQADIENNTIRGKIFLQPVGAIEYISLDFQVTNTLS